MSPTAACSIRPLGSTPYRNLRNAGATVVGEEVVIDGNVISSWSPDDVPALCRAIVEYFAHSADAASGR